MIAELVRRATGVEVFAAYVEALAGAPVPQARLQLDGLCGQHLLCTTTSGRIRKLELPDAVATDKRMISHGLDLAVGETIEPDVVPVEYIGYVTFIAATRGEAAQLREACDRGFTIEIETEPAAEANR
jgi:hypothetical protein